MLAGFFLSLREGIEAALIIGVLLGALDKLNYSRGKSSVWIGTLAAVFVSVIVGIGLNLVGASFEGQAEEIFEGVTMLLAAGVLTWVILWMQAQSKAMSQKLEADVRSVLKSGNHSALLLLSFLAVIREGVELAFFLTAASINTDGRATLIGAGLGLIAVAVLAVLLFKSLVRLDIGRFFRVTSIILIIFAAGLVAHGMHEFNEAGIIPSVIEHLWDVNHILDEKSGLGQLLKTLVGYNGNPSLTEVLSYLLYFVVLWWASRRRPANQMRTKAAAET